MKAKFRTFYKLMGVLILCGLILFFYTGCSSNSGVSYPSPLGLNPPNGAAFNDVFFKNYGTNPFIDTEDDHFSTFGMDVDTASYAIMRRYLREGLLPPPEAVRVEEFVNAFNYNYMPPSHGAFAVHIEGAPSRFGEGKRLQLLRIGIQGRVLPNRESEGRCIDFRDRCLRLNGNGKSVGIGEASADTSCGATSAR